MYNTKIKWKIFQMYTITNDGSVVDDNGKVIFFSVERFVKDICEGDCCFICGASPSDVKFNNEHILPEWILKKYDLYSKTINLPNETIFKYAQYKIPCCLGCNSLMGKVFERPFRELVNKGYKAFTEYIENNGFTFLLNWLAIIFLKTHLKDKSLRINLDTREKAGNIADFYNWEELYHIHCVARSFYTKCKLDPKIQGTLYILPAEVSDEFEEFDYIDIYAAKTMLLRLGNIAIIHVLDDSCAVMNLHFDTLKKITRPLSHLQLRELTATFAHANMDLIERPRFYSEFDRVSNTCKIMADIPEKMKFVDFDPQKYGSIMHYCFKDFIQAIPSTERTTIESHIKKGDYTFLFDEDGNLINQ